VPHLAFQDNLRFARETGKSGGKVLLLVGIVRLIGGDLPAVRIELDADFTNQFRPYFTYEQNFLRLPYGRKLFR
jgi:hypothetical protein